MSIMAYWPVVAMGITYGIAGMGGYVDLRLEDNTFVKEIERLDGRISIMDTINDRSFVTVNNEVDDLSESVDTNEEAIEEIQRILIQRQGQTDLKVQQIQNSLENQDMKFEQLFDLLQDLRNNQ